MTGDRKVARYVAARTDVLLLQRQLATYPELGQSPQFLRDLHAAQVTAHAALHALTGGQLARAQAALAQAPALSTTSHPKE